MTAKVPESNMHHFAKFGQNQSKGFGYIVIYFQDGGQCAMLDFHWKTIISGCTIFIFAKLSGVADLGMRIMDLTFVFPLLKGRFCMVAKSVVNKNANFLSFPPPKKKIAITNRSQCQSDHLQYTHMTIDHRRQSSSKSGVSTPSLLSLSLISLATLSAARGAT